jgi:hypothetical protein
LTIVGISCNTGGDVWFVDPISCAAFCCSERNVNSNIRCFHKVPCSIGETTKAEEIPTIAPVVDSELLEQFICGIYKIEA